MRKALIICILAISITLMVNVKAYAEDEPSATPTATPTPTPYQVLPVNNDPVDLSSVYYYYSEVLNVNQKQIVRYLTGCYNYMYMKSRGFEYNDVNDNSELIERILDFGTRFWDDGFKNASRYNGTFQRYLKAIVNYAGTQNVDIVTWISQNTDYYIPYSVEGLEAWTTFYNDPSTEGIANWGYQESDWVSGQYYNYAFEGYGFYGNTGADYQSYLLNNSPVLYTNVKPNAYDSTYGAQYIISLKDTNYFDSLYVLRSANDQYTSYRYGFQNGVIDKILFVHGVAYTDSRWPGKVYFYQENYANNVYFDGTVKSIPANNLSNLISYAFYNVPIRIYSDQTGNLTGFYPFISHVYLVDDLNTLSNKEEITNSSDLNIDGTGAKWIKTPKGPVLYWPTTGQLIEYDIPDLKKDDGEGNLVTIDPTKDIEQQVVNNNVINNYQIIAPGVVINVPVDWFESEGNYLDYTYNYSLPFFAFIGDVFLSLGEIRIFLLAGVILLICGGVIGKFLL